MNHPDKLSGVGYPAPLPKLITFNSDAMRQAFRGFTLRSLRNFQGVYPAKPLGSSPLGVVTFNNFQGFHMYPAKPNSGQGLVTLRQGSGVNNP